MVTSYYPSEQGGCKLSVGITSTIATVVAMTTPGFDPDLDLPRDEHPVGTRIYDREGNPIAIVISEFSKGEKASD